MSLYLPTVTEIEFHGQPCLRIASEQVELIASLAVGPRILSCRLNEGPNLFFTADTQLGRSGEAEWRIRGGHRLWTSPEAKPRTYELDNFPIRYHHDQRTGEVLLEGNLDPVAGVEKRITLKWLSCTQIEVLHEITNRMVWPVDLAPWALTVMAPGGHAVIPLLPRQSHETHLLPDYTLIPWTYTDFSLPLWKFLSNYILIDSSKARMSQKIGLSNYGGWLAYWQEGGTLFKSTKVIEGKTYPDFGSVVEVFCNKEILELESLGPLGRVLKNQTVEHAELWHLVPGLPQPLSAEIIDHHYRSQV